MTKDKYNNPKITISKVYTRTGDLGMTSLVGGQSVSKSDSRICAYGKIDELNSYIGACKQYLSNSNIDSENKKNLAKILYRIQNELFNIGNMLATLDDDRKKSSKLFSVYIHVWKNIITISEICNQNNI